MAVKKKKRREVVSAKNRLEKRENEQGFRSSTIKLPEGVEQFRFQKAGVYLLDIIPYEVGEGNPYADPGSFYYERTFKVHRGIGPNKGMYVCPKHAGTDDCPICEYVSSQYKNPNLSEKERKVLSALGAKERQLFNVYDRKNPDEGVQVLDISYHLFGKLLDARIEQSEMDEDEEENWSSFADPENGYTLKLTVASKSLEDNTFYEVVAIDFKARKSPISQEILDAAVCLDDVLLFKTYAQLEKLMFGEISEKASSKKSATSSKKNKSTPVEEEDDDDDDIEDEDEEDEDEDLELDEDELDEDEEEEEEEEPAPKKKRGRPKGSTSKTPASKKKKSAPVEEEEDEEEDEDEDEEEEPAPKRGRGRPKGSTSKKSTTSTKKKKSAPVEEEDDDDLDLEDDEDEDFDDDDDLDLEDEEDEDFDDEDEDDDDLDLEDEEDEEEDEPAPKRRGRPSKKK